MCDRCGNEPCTCQSGMLVAPHRDRMRSVKSTKSGVRWYLCEWSQGCNIPCRTNPSGDPLCRWHEHCKNKEDHARNPEACRDWLAWMQKGYPSTGWWGWDFDRLWPVLTGHEEIIK